MTAARRPPPRPRDAGITLLELVVVLAIFSMVAVMGLGALRGALRAQEGMERRDAQTAQLARALTLLRADIEAMTPLPFDPPGQDPAEPPLVDGGGFLALSLAGQPGLPGERAGGLSRVIWRFDVASGELTRQVWLALRPDTVADLRPEVVMLDGLRDFQVRSYLADTGWISGYGRDGPPDLALPVAVDVAIVSAGAGALRVLVVP